MTRSKAGILALAVAAAMTLMVTAAVLAGEPDSPAGRTSGEPDQPLGGRTSGEPDAPGGRIPDGEPDAPGGRIPDAGEPDVGGGGKIPGSVPVLHLIRWIGDLLVLP